MRYLENVYHEVILYYQPISIGHQHKNKMIIITNQIGTLTIYIIVNDYHTYKFV